MNLQIIVGEKTYALRVEGAAGAYRVLVDGAEQFVDFEQPEPCAVSLLIEGRSYDVFIARNGSDIVVSLAGKTYQGSLDEPYRWSRRTAGGNNAGQADEICAPMPGKVLSILVEKGAHVAAGDGLIVVEAMKMENELKAPRAGTIGEVYVQEGARVSAREPLLTIS